MKKLVLSLVAVAGMFFVTQDAQAQVEETTDQNQTETQQQTAEDYQQKKDDFQKVEVVALPQAIKDAVLTDYEGAVTEEAWVKEKDGESKYKLSINVDGETKKVYADEEGNWIDKDKKKDKKRDDTK